MTKTHLATMCVIWIQGTIACGSSTTSDPIGGTGKDRDGGGGGAVSSSGGASGRSGGAGASSTTGGATGAAGAANGGRGGARNTGGGGTASGGGSTASGGASTASGGGTASGGTVGDGGAVVCSPVHPNVNGSARTCNSGFCYCSGNDGCFSAGTASPCCKEAVVCGAGAVNPVASIYHPGSGETRAPNVAIPFSGVASDPQDGTLSGASLVWTSSRLTAPIGTGLSFQAPLPAGTHIITLTATDADSNTGTDTVTLLIQ